MISKSWKKEREFQTYKNTPLQKTVKQISHSLTSVMQQCLPYVRSAQKGNEKESLFNKH
jgi:hypothetical protein